MTSLFSMFCSLFFLFCSLFFLFSPRVRSTDSEVPRPLQDRDSLSVKEFSPHGADPFAQGSDVTTPAP